MRLRHREVTERHLPKVRGTAITQPELASGLLSLCLLRSQGGIQEKLILPPSMGASILPSKKRAKLVLSREELVVCQLLKARAPSSGRREVTLTNGRFAPGSGGC